MSLSAYFAARGVAQAPLPSGGSVVLDFGDAAREHLATRRGVGLFDFSFMGWWSFQGLEALACLQRLQTRDLRGLRPGRLCYTLLCRDDGTVFVDATVWRHGPHHLWLVTGRQTDVAAIEGAARDFDVTIVPLAASHTVIAVQGPDSAELMTRAWPGSVDDLPYFAFRRHCLDDGDAWVGRLGYTGELGYELLVGAAHAAVVWRRLATTELSSGATAVECGFEAADSLRIEAGFIHFAHELAGPVLPAELGLSRLVGLERPGFAGHEALRRAQRHVSRRLVGFELDAAPVRGMPVRRAVASTLQVTSSAYSPLFARTLGMGFAASDLAVGSMGYAGDGRRVRLARLPFRDPTRALARQDVALRRG